MSPFAHALQVLEFDALRERLAEHCETSMAAARALELEPSPVHQEVEAALSRTAEAHRLLGVATPPSLGAARDLADALRRAEKGGVLGGSELAAVADLLRALRAFREFFRTRGDAPFLAECAAQMADLRNLERKLTDSLDSGGEVLDSASPKLATLRKRVRSTSARILERIQSYTTRKTRDYLSDPIYTQRDGRYVIPVKSEHRGKVRGIVHDSSGSGQTVYIEPDDVLQLGNDLKQAESEAREEEHRILRVLSEAVGAECDPIRAGTEAAAEADFALAKARLGYAMKATLPDLEKRPGAAFQGARHPLLDPATCVPLDLTVGFGETGVLITGPNTGGKTVAIKTVGLAAAMAQSGLMVPATHARVGVFSGIHADIGDEQSLQQSLSTFSSHIRNIAEALTHLRPGGLVLLDEVGAGTDPAEGAALAQAILRKLRDREATVVASTHYGELKAFAYNEPGFVNAAMEFDQKSLRPTYRLLMGSPGASHALKIAERYGIPKDVVEEARQGLGEQHVQVSEMMQRLDEAQKLARNAQGDADRRAAELRRAEERAAEKLREADDVRRTVHAKATAQVEEALRSIRLQAAEIFEDLKRQGVSAQALDAARKKLRSLEGEADSALEPFQTKLAQPKRVEAVLAKGSRVRLEGYAQEGVVLDDPKDGQTTVQIGPLKLKAKLADLVPVAGKAPAPKATGRTGLGLSKAQTAKMEIHLRAMRAEDAQRELERFLDDAVLAGLSSVRIVHGKGEGILREVTRSYLRQHPQVATFKDAEPAEGGAGVTVATLK